MIQKVLAFIKSRPTESWLALYTAAVAVASYFGVDLEALVVQTVSTVIAALTTFLASRPTNDFGPK